ncbi:MAG: ABC transporter ATP-binding protein [Chlamydiae bacterium]|nr:MAG: ABC transporter ATP-binding protein [Chlamydiota bacterium]
MSKLKIENLIYRNCGPINLSVNAGECICIYGKSGTGKSLLLRSIADIDPHYGEIFLNDKEQSDFHPCEWRKCVAMLPSENRWWHENVGDHFPKTKNHLFNKLDFNDDVTKWNVARLSTGESQRLALIRLFSNNPEVLLLDEPTAGLDVKSTALVEEIVNDYMIENNAAVIWVSHDPEQAKRISQKHFLFKDGNIVKTN